MGWAQHENQAERGAELAAEGVGGRKQVVLTGGYAAITTGEGETLARVGGSTAPTSLSARAPRGVGREEKAAGQALGIP